MARAPKYDNRKSPRDWPQMRFGKRDMPERQENLIEIGKFSHFIKNTPLVVVKLTEKAIPYFTAIIFNEEGAKIASVHEVFGKLDADVFCSIKLEDRKQLQKIDKDTRFKADKFKCLSFEKVAGASRADESVRTQRNKNLPQPGVKRQRSTKYRTRAENERVVEYAGKEVLKNVREFRDNKKKYLKQTAERKGTTTNIRRITFTE